MRRINRKVLIIFLSVLVIVFCIVIFNYLNLDNNKDDTLKISYISMEEKSENLKFVSQGIEQAEKDMKVKVNICTLTDDNKIENQRKLLKREMKNGADSIIIAPIDYKELSFDIEAVNEVIPVILIDSKIQFDKKIITVSADNYSIGKSLGEEILKNGNTRSTIGIIEKDINCSSFDEIRSGFMDEMKYSKNKCINIRVGNDKENFYKQIEKYIKDKKVNVLVSFNDDVLETIAEIKENIYKNEGEKIKTEIYGVGRTDKILGYVENEIIDGTIVKNEFNAGYLAVEIAKDRVKNKGKNKEEAKIDFLVINKRNMYLENNQKLIFPFIG